MSKPSQATKAPASARGHESSARSTPASPHPEEAAALAHLIEIKPGLFLNVNQIVSLRVLSQENGDAYAILHLSNGDKLDLSREEFATIGRKEAHSPARPSQKPPAE